jgi:NHL repeat
MTEAAFGVPLDASAGDSDYLYVAGWGPRSDGTIYREMSDVAVGPGDVVHVLTRQPGKVLVYSARGVLLRSWEGGPLGERPHGIAVGADGAVYCVDEFDHTVHVYTSTGEHLRDIGISGKPSDTGVNFAIKDLYERTATITRPAGPFNHPAAIAVTPDSELYVADGYGNCRIHHFTSDGRLLQSWGEPGVGPGQFHIPHGICFDADNELVMVADRENERIQLFTPDGRHVGSWIGLQRPADVTLGPDGLVYVAELGRAISHRSWTRPPVGTWQPSRLSVLDRKGHALARIGVGGDPSAPGIMAAAHGIALDSLGDIYVAEITYTSLRTRADAVDGRPVPATCHTFQKLARRERAEVPTSADLGVSAKPRVG